RVTWDKRKSKPQRGDYWACCPFHGEKTPSFHADDRRGHYHCFGCGVSGDHFTFLVEQDGLSFPQAVEQLAGEAGLPMPARDEAEEKREEQRASLAEVMELAAKFFEGELQAAEGAKARGYLRDRGVSPETQTRFRIGYAPDSRKALKEHLVGKGVAQDQMFEAGLLIAGDDIPVSYDRFRDRVMFPITDLRGRVIAFGGRALSADVPAKYLNSPETPLFSKSHVLFNGREARAAARKDGPVIAVEGYTDVIACVTAGFAATVAPMGTALTEEQLRLLWQMADEPVLCFDGDAAGLKAAYRAVDLALPHLKPGKSLRFALLPAGQDPDDVIRADGPEAFGALIGAARALIDMAWRREMDGKTYDTPERRAGLEATLRQVIWQIGDQGVRRHYDTAIRDRLAAYFGSGTDRRGRSRPSAARRGNAGMVASESLLSNRLVRTAGRNLSASAPALADAILVGGLLCHPSLAEERLEILADTAFRQPDIARLSSALALVLAEHPDADHAGLRALLEGQGHGAAIDLVLKTLRQFGLEAVGPEGEATRAATIWDDAAHLRRRAGSLSVERLEAARALGRDASAAHLTRLRDIQDQDIRQTRGDMRDGVSEIEIVHPFKDR
ncbi:MAG TPA: DNA primase, partial [Afifellaceae bacterium]|nr:DNA primase [Afifellaceae bacterium]